MSSAALRLADVSDVVTYELEHVAADVVEAVEARVAVRPGHGPLVVTQDRLAERRFVEAGRRRGRPVARGPVRGESARAAADALGLPLRLKLPIGGYDGRGQLRIASRRSSTTRWGASAGRPGAALLAERELDFAAELSVDRRARARRRVASSRSPGTPMTTGILVESVAPAPVRPTVAARAARSGRASPRRWTCAAPSPPSCSCCPTARWSSTSWRRASTTRGHWTIEGAATSQFEQHIRAICGLGLGSTAALAPDRDGQPARDRSVARPASAASPKRSRIPTVHLHLYDKRRVFERRKMGHLTALGPMRTRRWRAARAALAALHWAGGATRRTIDDRGPTPSRRPVVGIVGGSRSDFPTLEEAVAILDELGVSSELRVVSAHRTPDRLFRYAEEAAGRGIKVIVAGAGGAAHLPGMLAAKTALPVIGVPIPTEHLGGLDSLLSIVQMPRGVPVATVGDRERHQRRAARRLDPGPWRSGPRRAPRGVAFAPDPGRPRRPVERLGLTTARRSPAATTGTSRCSARWNPRSSAVLSSDQHEDRRGRGAGQGDRHPAEDDRDVEDHEPAVGRRHLLDDARPQVLAPADVVEPVRDAVADEQAEEDEQRPRRGPSAIPAPPSAGAPPSKKPPPPNATNIGRVRMKIPWTSQKIP